MFRFRALFNRTQFVNFFSRKTSLEYKKAQDEKLVLSTSELLYFVAKFSLPVSYVFETTSSSCYDYRFIIIIPKITLSVRFGIVK